MKSAKGTGRANRENGKAFEQRIADLYRLLNYTVEPARLFHGREVDLFLTRRVGDLVIHRGIECKAGPVRVEEIDEFVAKLRLIRKDFPSAIGTIVSGVSFTPAVAAHAAAEGIQLTLARDLASQLIDGHSYTTNLIREVESDDRYSLPLYVEPQIGNEPVGEDAPAFETVSTWLRDADWNQLTLLGDVGTGKSFLARMIAHRLAKAFQENQFDNPLPIFIDLRHADREISLEGLIITHLNRSGLSDASFPAFQYALAQGNVVLILDGFDEMASRITPQVTARNFNELARAVTGRAKVLLTCRTHYFRSRTEEEEVILGSTQDERSASQLYWELIARRGFRIAYLRPFDLRQIEAYVRLALHTNAEEMLRRIRKTYNLLELSQRPMLLDMIVKSIDALRAGTVNPAMLYTAFTNAWIRRDTWRDVISPDAKLAFLTGLAKTLWHTDQIAVHHSSLQEYVQSEFSSLVANPRELFEIDAEVRTATFLTRDESGHYGFAHKSYSEFFVARYVATELSARRTSCLDTRRFGPELVEFLADMSNEQIEEHLALVLRRDYVPRVSENALVCLYGIRRARLRRSLDERPPEAYLIEMLEAIRLDGADLIGVTLEGASMPHARFRSARLSGAVMAHTILDEADLTGADLQSADFAEASLRHARLDGALIGGCNFDGCDLSGASLRGTDVRSANFSRWKSDNVDLGGVVTHDSPGPVNPLFEGIRATVGDDQLEQLFLSMKRSAYQIALRYGVDPDDLIDATALLLVRPETLKRLVSMEPQAQNSYLRVVLARQSIGLARDAGRRTISLEDIEGELVSPDTTALDALLDRETEERVSRALEQLAPDVLHVIRLRYLDGLTVAEIAENVGLSTSSVHNRIRVGIRQIRSLM